MLPNLIRPMLATEAPEPFDSDRHIFEVKWDGVRCLAFVENRHVRLQSRKLVDITPQFPELVCLSQLPSGTVLDGELVAIDSGRPSLTKIQGRVQMRDNKRIGILAESAPVVYVAFDLLFLRGQSLLRQALCQRRQALERICGASKPGPLVLSEAVTGQGQGLFATAVKLGLEGIMAKSVDGHYAPGRRTSLWQKTKAAKWCKRHGLPSSIDIFGTVAAYHHEPGAETAKEFLERWGVNWAPYPYLHIRLAMKALGFDVLCLSRLDTHAVWCVEMRTTATTDGYDRQQIQRIVGRALCSLDWPERPRDLTVVKTGRRVVVSFVWDRGKPLIWEC